MSFLASVAALVIEWLLKIGGKALYEAVTDFVHKQKQKKNNEENLKEHKKDIEENASPDEKGKSGRKLINGD